MLISLERLGKDDIDSLKRNFEKFLFSKAKVEMLLNVDKPEQKVIIDGMDKLLKNCLKDKNTFSTEEAKKERDEIIEASRKLFGIHWKKIKEQK